MVILGQWPYQHTETLDKMRSDGLSIFYYNVDKDKIISENEAIKISGTTVTSTGESSYIRDEIYLTVMSEDMHNHILFYLKQNFPPSIHPDLRMKPNAEFVKIMNKVKNSSALMVVNNQGKDVMEDIGAMWNSSLGLYIIHEQHLKALRCEKRKAHGGKIQVADLFGSSLKIWGDTTPHIDLLMNAGAKFDEKSDSWIISMSSIDKISSILQ